MIAEIAYQSFKANLNGITICEIQMSEKMRDEILEDLKENVSSGWYKTQEGSAPYICGIPLKINNDLQHVLYCVKAF